MMIPEVKAFQIEIYDYATKMNPQLMKIIRERKKLDDEITKGMDEVLAAYLKMIQEKRPKDEEEEEADSNVGVDSLDTATSKKPEAAKAK